MERVDHPPHGRNSPFSRDVKDSKCTVEAAVLRPDVALTLLIGEGFAPSEVVKQSSASRGGQLEGEVLRAVLPFVRGFNNGQTSGTLQGSKRASDHHIQLRFLPRGRSRWVATK